MFARAIDIHEARLTKQVKLILEYEGATPGSLDVESVWASPVPTGFAVDNIPFRAQGIALGDVVSAEPDEDGMLRFRSLVMPSGHSTIRLWFSKEHENLVPSVRQQLREMGCISELSDLPRLVAVDIPPSVSYDRVRQIFERGEKDGTFEYEEGCVAHR